jgi:hypothetical protein
VVERMKEEKRKIEDGMKEGNEERKTLHGKITVDNCNENGLVGG